MAVPPQLATVIRQAIGGFIATTIQHLQDLEQGKLQRGERPPNGPWVDITKKEIEALKQRIAALQSLQANIDDALGR
jgi:hypothetical protein